MTKETIRVDVLELLYLAGRLRGLQEEFDSLQDVLKGYESAVGSARIADRLESFATNWSDRRKEVGRRIDNVAGYAARAAEAYGGLEEELSTYIDEASARGGSKGHAERVTSGAHQRGGSLQEERTEAREAVIESDSQ